MFDIINKDAMLFKAIKAKINSMNPPKKVKHIKMMELESGYQRGVCVEFVDGSIEYSIIDRPLSYKDDYMKQIYDAIYRIPFGSLPYMDRKMREIFR